MEGRDNVKITPQKINSIWNDPQSLGIIIAIIAVALTFLFFTIYRKSLVKKNSILLLGICEAGKTLIFTRLVYKKFSQTFTSMKENIGEYICGPTVFNIIDVPGHERLRNRVFDQYKTSTRGLVFVVDSSTIQKDIKDAAEFLYHCLTDSFISSNVFNLLILCNKQEEPLAKSSSVIKTLFEKELNILRTTQTHQLESIGKNTNTVMLGKEGKDFEFAHLSPMKVEFAECSAIMEQDKDDYNLKALEEWIKSLI